MINERLCTRHTIPRSELEAIALAKIQNTVALAKENKEKFAEKIYNSANKEAEKALKIKSSELSKAETRIGELDKIISRTYEDHIVGKLSDERFAKILGGFESEQAALKVSVEALQAEIGELKSNASNLNSFMELVSRFGEITELTAEMARIFIERIVVHEPVYKNGCKRIKESQEINVYLTFLKKATIED